MQNNEERSPLIESVDSSSSINSTYETVVTAHDGVTLSDCDSQVYENIIYAWMHYVLAVDFFRDYSLARNLLKYLAAWEKKRLHPPINLASPNSIAAVQIVDNFVFGAEVFSEILFPPFLFGLLTHDVFQYISSPQARVNNHLLKILFPPIFAPILGFTENRSILSSQWPRSWWVWHPSMILSALALGGGTCLLFSRTTMYRYEFLRSLEAIAIAECRSEIKTQYAEALREIKNLTNCMILDREERKDSNERIKKDTFLERLIEYSEARNFLIRLEAIKSLAKGAYEFNKSRKFEKLARPSKRDYKKWQKEAVEALQKIAVEEGFSLEKIYANYLLWSNGYEHQYRYDSIFIAPSFIISLALLYSNYRLLWSLFQLPVEAIVNAIYNAIASSQCRKQFRVYTYMPQSASYECTACGDWMKDVYYKDVFKSQSCIDSLLQSKQQPKKIIAALKRILPFGISHIDFSRQDWWEWQDEEMKLIFNLAKESAKNRFDYFNLNCATPMPQVLSQNKTSIILDTFTNFTVTAVNFTNSYFPINATARIIERFGNETKVIDLSNMHLGREDAESLAMALNRTINLQRLMLANNDFDNDAMVVLSPVLQNQKNLTVLNLAGNSFNEIGIEELSKRKFSSLKILDLSNLKLKGANLTAIESLIKNSTLEEFFIRNSDVNDQGLSTFVDGLKEGGLQLLDLSSNKLTPRSGLILGEAFKNSTLKAVILTQNAISDKGVVYLARFLPTTTLTRIELNEVNLSNLGLKYLSQYLPQTKINDIDLSSNQITALGISYFRLAIEKMNITRIALNNNVLGDLGLNALVEVMPHLQKTLHSIQLANTGLEKISNFFKALTNAIYLQQVDLQGNHITERDYVIAMNALAKTNINWLNLCDTEATPKVLQAITQQLPLSQQLKGLDISENNLGDTALIAFIKRLLKTKWIDDNLLVRKKIAREEMWIIHEAKPTVATLKALSINYVNISTKAARGICRILPSTHIDMRYLSMQGNFIDDTQINLKSCYVSSGAARVELPLIFLLPQKALNVILQFVRSLYGASASFQKQLQQSSLDLSPSVSLPNNSSLQEPSNFAMECVVHDHSLECKLVSYSNGQVNFLYAIADIAQQHSQFSPFSLEYISAFILAFRHDIAKVIQPYLPKSILSLCKYYGDSKESLLINEVGEMALRAKHSRAALVHDVTKTVKGIVIEQNQEQQQIKVKDKKSSDKIEGMFSKAAKALVTLGSSYGAAYAIGYLTGNPLFGYALMPILSKSPRIYRAVSTSYRQQGFFEAVDTVINEISLAVPGGEYVRKSLQ